MLWHILRLELAHLNEGDRRSLEDQLGRLGEVPQVRWFLTGRDADDAGVTGVIMLMDDLDALRIYRDHPIHREVAQTLRGSSIKTQRLDLIGDSLPGPG